jgi:subtilisin family serine protease
MQLKKQYVADVRILASSFSDGYASRPLYDEIQAAGMAGMLLVTAAGNCKQNITSNSCQRSIDILPTYPAAYSSLLENVISVAATDNRDKLWEDSKYGVKNVDFAAPGVDILSTVPVNEFPSGYAYMSGTSWASPYVSGIAALVLSVCPNLTPAELKRDLLDSVDVLPSLQGKVLSGGRVNAAKAIAQAGSECIPGNHS